MPGTSTFDTHTVVNVELPQRGADSSTLAPDEPGAIAMREEQRSSTLREQYGALLVCRAERVENRVEYRALADGVDVAIAHAQLVQLLRPSLSYAAVGNRKVVEQQDVTGVKRDAAFNAVGPEPVSREVDLLVCE